MRAKLIAIGSVLGAALLGAGLVIATQYEANAETFTAPVTDTGDDLTGPQAACFGNCAKAVWPEITIANVKDFDLWKQETVDEHVEQVHAIVGRALRPAQRLFEPPTCG